MIIEYAKFNPVFEDIRRRLEHDAEPADLESMEDGFWRMVATNRGACELSVWFEKCRHDYLRDCYERAAFYIACKMFDK